MENRANLLKSLGESLRNTDCFEITAYLIIFEHELELLKTQKYFNLGDKLYEKRKAAALEIEVIIKELIKEKKSL